MLNDIKGVLFSVYKAVFKRKIIDTNTSMQIEKLIQLLKHKKQIILQGPPGTGKTYLAKKIAEKMVGTNAGSDNIKLVQFHPSYSYEDFVRGITVKSNENGQIEYCTDDKIFVQMINFAVNKSEIEYTRIDKLKKQFESDIEKEFKNFSENVINEINNNKIFKSQKFTIEENRQNVYVNGLGDFKNKGDKWVVMHEDVINFAKNQCLGTNYYIRNPDYKNIRNIRDHFVDKYLSGYTFNKLKVNDCIVLIIDEINRANLPSVLGELIYALEYRGEEVECMYAKNSKSKISIPENLYIIGTMNTADRSVGHIDYAIRRRFAFESILPDDKPINNEKAKELFHRVSEIFIKRENSNEDDALIARSSHVASDFDYRDVQIGHSYFILKDEDDKNQDELKMRWKYEIYPILREYIKDGILLETANNEIDIIIKEFGFDS